MATRYFGFGSVQECQDFIAAQIRRTIRATWQRITTDVAIDNGSARSISVARDDHAGIKELELDSADAYDLLFADLVELVEQTSDVTVSRIEFQLTGDGESTVTIQ